MNANEVTNQWQFYAHTVDAVFEKSTFEIFIIAVSLLIVGGAMLSIIRNWKIAKTMPSPKNCAECQFDRSASNAIQDLNAKIGRDHEDFQARQRSISEELTQLSRLVRELRDSKNEND